MAVVFGWVSPPETTSRFVGTAWGSGGLFGGQAFLFAAEAFLHLLVRLFGAVVPGAEPLIQRDQPIAAIVHLKVFVVQVVGVGVAVGGEVFAHFQLVKADMADNGAVGVLVS